MRQTGLGLKTDPVAKIVKIAGGSQEGPTEGQWCRRCWLRPTDREGRWGARLLLLSRRDEKTHAFDFFSRVRLCVYFVCNVYLFMLFSKNLKKCDLIN